MENAPISYQPAAFFYRQALRQSRSKAEAIEWGMLLVREIEMHKQWIREHGLVPPRWLITQTQQEARVLAELIPFSTTGLGSGKAE